MTREGGSASARPVSPAVNSGRVSLARSLDPGGGLLGLRGVRGRDDDDVAAVGPDVLLRALVAVVDALPLLAGERRLVAGHAGPRRREPRIEHEVLRLRDRHAVDGDDL